MIFTNIKYDIVEISILNNITCIVVHYASLYNFVQHDDGLIKNRHI